MATNHGKNVGSVSGRNGDEEKRERRKRRSQLQLDSSEKDGQNTGGDALRMASPLDWPGAKKQGRVHQRPGKTRSPPESLATGSKVAPTPAKEKGKAPTPAKEKGQGRDKAEHSSGRGEKREEKVEEESSSEEETSEEEDESAEEKLRSRRADMITAVPVKVRGFLSDHGASEDLAEAVMREVKMLAWMAGHALHENACLKTELKVRKRDNVGPRLDKVEKACVGLINVIDEIRRDVAKKKGREENVSVGAGVGAPVPRRTFAVVVRGREGVTPDLAKERLVEDLRSKTVVRVDALRETRGGLLVETRTEGEREALLLSRSLKEAGLVASKPAPLLPRVIVYDCFDATDALLKEIHARNVCDILEWSEFRRVVKVVKRLPADGDTGKPDSERYWHLILEVPMAVRNRLVEAGRTYVFHEAYKTRAYDRVPRCFVCHAYGHRARECKSRRLCSRCCEPDHLAKECEKPLCCGNCWAIGSSSDHSVLSVECPQYKRRLALLWRRFEGS